ncbi:MAG: hypothetical protein HKO81_05840 [Flavobacteriaceae bacterium]|nr:hypothetical protein [Flavobacteriaceae bacterium]
MKNILRMFVIAALVFMVSQVIKAEESKDIIKTEIPHEKTSKVYVVLKVGKVNSSFVDSYGQKIKDRFAKEGIDVEYAILSGKLPNAIYQIALRKGADHILFINQTRQYNIDGKTNVGGFYEVKAFSLGDYVWTDIEKNIKMNVQFNKSILSANNRIIESFLNKI